MDWLLDLTDLKTTRYFVVGEIHGDHDALMRLLFQQKFTWSDTLITTGDFLDFDNPKCIELCKFIRNAMSCYSVKGEYEINFLKDVENPEKASELEKKLDKDFNNYIIDYIRNLPLVIKIKDFYVMHAGVDPTKSLEKQDPGVFYTIGEYDADSRFYQYPNPEKSSWYNTPFLVDGKHVKIGFGHIYLEDFEVPAGFNLGRKHEVGSPYRALIIDKQQQTVNKIMWQ